MPVEHEEEHFVLVDASAMVAGDYDRRDPVLIQNVIVHHTEDRGWPGFSTTSFFVPFRPELRDGRAVIFRTLPDEAAFCFRFKGVGVAFEGLFKSPQAPDAGSPSDIQVAIFGSLIAYLRRRYKLDALCLFGHSDFIRSSHCPGDDLEIGVDLLRADAEDEGMPALRTWCERHAALVKLGELGEGSDFFGFDTVHALKKLQRRHGWPVTGSWTRPVDTFIRRALARLDSQAAQEGALSKEAR